jgi:hypothetical protein
MSRHPRKNEAKLLDSVAVAYWLTPADAAMIRAARDLAEQLDGMVTPAQQALVSDTGAHASKTAYVMQTYHHLLRALGLTPEGRRQLGIEAEPERDELAKVLDGYFTDAGD